MITSDLISYIQAQIKKNIPKDLIILHLSEKGWHSEDIEEGFLKVSSISNLNFSSTQPENKVEIKDKWLSDPYRELPGAESAPIVTPIEIKTKSPQKIEDSKIWVPMNIKAVTQSVPELKIETPKEEIKTNPIESFPQQVSPNISTEIKNEIPTIKQEFPERSFNGPVLSAVSFNQPTKSFADFKTKVSDLNQTSQNLSAEKPIIQVPVKPIVSTNTTSPIEGHTVPDFKNLNGNTPDSAIISSFQQDISSVSFVKNEETDKKNKSTLKIISIVFIIFLITGGIIFAFINNYIKIPFSIIKEDPKVVLLNTSTNFSKLKSYKTQTEITLSSPSFANITSGLSSGEAVVSNDRDSITVNAKGLVNKNGPAAPSVYDYYTVVKSSFLKNHIISDIKYDGSTSYIKVPNLSEIFGTNSPSKGTVSIPSGQFNLITQEFPSYFQDKINKIGVFDILSNVMSNSFGDKFSSSFNDLINSSTMAEKQNENINGQDSYHYEIIVDRQNTKKFLIALMNTFATTISPDVKSSLEESIGATTIDSFEIWINKTDSNILQYKFKLSAPLSKIIGLDDKGIANNKVSIDWKTTFSDFNVANVITMPVDFIKMEDYVKDIHNMKIKNTLSSFDSSAKNLFNAEGSFGKHPNKIGSCTAPDSGSIFSPLGHDKGASTSISSISSTMNDLLSLTSGPSVCFSTLKAWAISSPIISEPQSFFCVDSTGVSNILTAQPIGPACVSPLNIPITQSASKI